MEKVPHPETEAQYWIAEAAVAAIAQEDAVSDRVYEYATERRNYALRALGMIGVGGIIRIDQS